MMKSLLVVVVAAVAAVGAVPVCHNNICAVIRCAYPNDCDGRVDPTGGFCGCCPACVAQLSAGESCDVSLFLGVGTHAECGKGLHCDTTSLTCVKSTRSTGLCALRHHEYLDKEQHLLGSSEPLCETDGTFKAKQCRGSGCYCVDTDGNDLGYFTNYAAGTDNMDCTCARDKAAYLKTGLIGKLFFCDNKGSYNKKQCTGSVCFCTDNNGKMLSNGQTVNIGEMDKLQC
ncbi:uncharacterized protein LOC124151063 isoform X2 [Haliotis rufescens]|uniref:uncharacterized protein LOC124151063 isoform X2 n=1 Tax=Haliotis rufescens TaxID=6454 RepID=UPI00201E7E3A|nr:uncharacterized protein LOC124151063 isoform X2 [Haliotis rufescens]